MNIDELKEALEGYFSNADEVGVAVYAILKGSERANPVKLDIESDAQGGIKELFFQSLRESISQNEELAILDLSSADERTNAIYLYDLDVPEELSWMEYVAANDDLPLLNLEDGDLTLVKGLIIEIGNSGGQIVLYKNMAPVNIFGRGSFFLKKSATRLEKLDDEFLRISPNFQVLRVNGVLFVIELEALERTFGFHDVIKREAAEGLAAIEGAEIVENPDVLYELVDDISYARKFTKIAKASPVLRANIPAENIVQFCRKFPKLVGRIRFNEAGDRIQLDTKVSKNLFIKLLMDDFLTSELTQFHYASVAKDSVDDSAEVDTED